MLICFFISGKSVSITSHVRFISTRSVFFDLCIHQFEKSFLDYNTLLGFLKYL